MIRICGDSVIYHQECGGIVNQKDESLKPLEVLGVNLLYFCEKCRNIISFAEIENITPKQHRIKYNNTSNQTTFVQ